MYTIISLTYKIDSNNIFKKLLKIKDTKYVKIEFNPLEGYIYYTDSERSFPLKKDLVRSYILFQEIFGRLKILGYEPSIKDNNIEKFIELSPSLFKIDKLAFNIVGTNNINKKELKRIFGRFPTKDLDKIIDTLIEIKLNDQINSI